MLLQTVKRNPLIQICNNCLSSACATSRHSSDAELAS